MNYAPPNLPTIDEQELPKVRRYLEVKEKIERFKRENRNVLDDYDELISEYNQSLEDAEKDVRIREVNCGPFVACGEMSKIDVDRLYDELGAEDFVKVGGIIETKQCLSIDKMKFKAMSAMLPQEVLDGCVTHTIKYTAPKKVNLP